MTKEDRIIGRGRIRVGHTVAHDFRLWTWPECCPPKSEYAGEDYRYRAKNPDMVFDVVWDGRWWHCKADGYGELRTFDWLKGEDHYGAGKILILNDFEAVELVSEDREKTDIYERAITEYLKAHAITTTD